MQLAALRTGPSALTVNDRDDIGCTPLHLAITHGKRPARLLCQRLPSYATCQPCLVLPCHGTIAEMMSVEIDDR